MNQAVYDQQRERAVELMIENLRQPLEEEIPPTAIISALIIVAGKVAAQEGITDEVWQLILEDIKRDRNVVTDDVPHLKLAARPVS